MTWITDRERFSNWYWTRKDNLIEMRVWWRASTARHILHLLPGESILEPVGYGSGTLTRALEGVSRGACPITAATVVPENHRPSLAFQLAALNRGSPAERVPR
jgi:dolichol-phosphate mannosyltransferase